MFQIVRLMDEQQSINKKIANQIPVIVQKSVQEQSKKPKRKGFLGIFGKKKEVTPAVSTTILHSVNRNVISEQKVQDRQLSEQADSLAARNAELNRQLQELICQIEEKVQTELQSRENEIVAMREKSFMQVGGLMGFVLLLLLISYIIIHRDAKSIKQYKHKTTDLIRQLEQSVQRNEALITSRKKAVHTITHELRTPLTAITGYAGLIRKEQCEDKSGQYIQNILQSSDRMRDMLNTLLDFFRLDNGKEQPRLSPCRISAITHTLETEFMPVAVNKGLSLSVKTGHDAIVLTDKERIIQIGNNLLSNAVKFTEEGGVSLITEYDNGVLTLVVEDTGTGMTEEEQKQAFGAFERLSNAAAKEGFGLGLAIMRNIVSMLGGTIRLDSKKGKGSRFTVEISMQEAEEQLGYTSNTPVYHNNKFHDVVAIDNDEVLLLMLKEMYSQEGIHCDTCTDAAALMEMIRQNHSFLQTKIHGKEHTPDNAQHRVSGETRNTFHDWRTGYCVHDAYGQLCLHPLPWRGWRGCFQRCLLLLPAGIYDRQCHRTIGTTHCQLQLRCRSAGEGDAGFPFLHIAGFCMWTVDDIGRHDRKSSDCVAVPFRRNDRR